MVSRGGSSHPFLLLAMPVVLLSAFSSGAGAQTGPHVAGEVSVTILRALAAQQESGLSFGRILPAAADGEISLSPAGALDCGEARLCSGTARAASFRIWGSDGLIAVTVPQTVQLAGPGAESISFQPVPSTHQISLQNGEGRLTLGGTLRIAAGQSAGVYQGQYEISLEYQ